MLTIRTLALGAMMIAGVAGVSVAQDSTMRRGHEARGGFARGSDLNLTDAQKAQIKAIHQKYQPQNQALRERAKPFMTAARTARQKGDTAGFRSNMGKARQVMQSGQSIRTQERAEVRAVLTPDQQAKFDAREKAMAGRRANGAEGGKRGWGRRGHGGPPAPAAKK